MLTNQMREVIRSEDFIIHCKEVDIWQDFDGGLQLNGHGSIKKNKSGLLYLEFICINNVSGKSRSRGFNDIYPFNRLDNKEKIYGKFLGLDNSLYVSDGFEVKVSSLNSGHQVIIIFLTNIKEVEQVPSNLLPDNVLENSLYMEFFEKIDIPVNKLNETKSSDGSHSSSWNETEILFENFKMNIIKKDGYTVINAKGNYSYDVMFDSIKFFISFISGNLIQPYLTSFMCNGEYTIHIYSIDKSLCQKCFFNLIPFDILKNSSHLNNLLKNMCILRNGNADKFIGLTSQWRRVWYGYNSVNDIGVLVLSVSIEGLINDFFINPLKKLKQNKEMQSDVENTINIIRKSELSELAKSKIIQSVKMWTEIRARKALCILAKKEVISHDEEESWIKLRNSAAHPQESKQSSLEDKKVMKLNNFMNCVNLFNKLILNIFNYSGAINIYMYPNEKSRVIFLEHRNILIDEIENK